MSIVPGAPLRRGAGVPLGRGAGVPLGRGGEGTEIHGEGNPNALPMPALRTAFSLRTLLCLSL